MNGLAEKFYEWAKNNGWNVEFSDEKRGLPEAVRERYKYIPAEWVDFIGCFNVCINGENNLYFQLAEDFEEQDNGFRWNEFEMISLEAAKGDEEWTANIREFWDNYLPIAVSVGGDYHYYAIGIKTGEVFDGWEPEFEEPEIVAAGFGDFIGKIISGEIELI
ncbi:MAG: hypothetical protein J1F09_01670 [Oscillospiraceae bacterium]|nr:hypothetical protein [Oscillospiraceae bacterium]